MKTLNNFLTKIHDSGRIAQDMTKKEMIDCLEIIADDMMTGKSTLLHANTLLSIRHGMMPGSERTADYAKNEKELEKAASVLGKKGGSAKSDAKTKAVRENAKLGGWPKGRSRKQKEE